ncbi:MAG: hypothetical protein KF812_09105 [Fimbriimonadaceae bacterium]|nr:hypothetical protein [Fimbriimonadaceae bacterium]
MISGLLLFAALAPQQAIPNTDGATSKVSPRVMTLLRKSEMIVVLPTEMPAGFECRNLTLDEGEEGFDLQMMWMRDSDEATITLQIAWEGLGDFLFPEGGTLTKKTVKTPFGDTVLQGNRTDGFFEWGHGWLPIPGTQSGELQEHYLLSGSGLSLDEAARIVGSVKILSSIE